MQLLPLPAFSDNYIWLLAVDNKAWVVDPGDAAPVLQALQQHRLTLAGILLTHHHPDHCGGIAALRAHFPVPVYGPANSPAAALITQTLQHGDKLAIDNTIFQIMAVPGHTLDHIAFYSAEEKLLLCGDTLFSGGCGRVFEGTHAQLFASLQQLAALPDDTHVCCAHEYTLSNLRFARAAEPGNADVARYLQHCEALRAADKPTLPSSIAQEKKINVFLRAGSATRFAELREWKNRF